MEVILYLLGNWCMTGAAAVVFGYYMSKDRAHLDSHVLVSLDLVKLMFLGQILRAYWCSSPPPIWYEEHPVIQFLAKSDLICSVLVWGAVWAIMHSKGGRAMTEETELEEKFAEEASSVTWSEIFLGRANDGANGGSASQSERTKTGAACVLRQKKDHIDEFGADALVKLDVEYGMRSRLAKVRTVAKLWPLLISSAIVALALSLVLPSLHTAEAWPCVDFMVIWNMLVDATSMIPQVLLITMSQRKACAESGTFMGLLCLGRVLRMIFWIILIGHPESGETLITFVLPDVMHTIVMGNYLHAWLQKVKRDATEYMGLEVMSV